MARPGYGAVSMSRRPVAAVEERRAVDLDRVGPALERRRRPGSIVSTNAARWSHGAPSSVTLPAGHGGGDDERAGLDPVGDDPVLGAAQALAALDLDRVGVGPLDRRAHRLEERDEVVDLGLLGGRADDRVALGEGRGEHRVLGAHDRHEREADLAAAQAPGRRSRSSSRCGTRSRRPSARIASTWRSTGRRPIRSPPGLLMMTRPNRVSSGPSRMKLARIRAAASSGTNSHSTSPEATS